MVTPCSTTTLSASLISYTSSTSHGPEKLLVVSKTKIHLKNCLKTCTSLDHSEKQFLQYFNQQGQSRWCEHTDKGQPVCGSLTTPDMPSTLHHSSDAE